MPGDEENRTEAQDKPSEIVSKVETMPGPLGSTIAVEKEESPKVEKPAGDDPKAKELEELRANNRQLAEIAEKSRREAQAAQAYVGTIVKQIEEAAGRADGARASAQGMTAEQMREAFEADPQAFLDHHFQTRMQPIAQSYLESQARLIKTHFEERVAADEDYKMYKGEVEEFMKDLTPDVRATPGAWERAFGFVKSQHLDEIADRRAQKLLAQKRESFSEGAGVSGTTGAKRISLNDEQKAIAKGLGLSEQEYIEYMGQP